MAAKTSVDISVLWYQGGSSDKVYVVCAFEACYYGRRGGSLKKADWHPNVLGEKVNKGYEVIATGRVAREDVDSFIAQLPGAGAHAASFQFQVKRLFSEFWDRRHPVNVGDAAVAASEPGYIIAAANHVSAGAMLEEL